MLECFDLVKFPYNAILEKVTQCVIIKHFKYIAVKEINMRSNLNLNEVSTLSTVLLTNLNETLFFSKISEFMMSQFGEYKVQVFEAFKDGSTLLMAENGKAIENGILYGKGEGLSGYVVRTKRAYYSNSKRDPLLASTKRDDVVESELSVPLVCEGMVLGTIHIQSKNSDRKFTDVDVATVNEILEQLEAPIANMKMYLIAKNLNKELQTQIEEKEKELLGRGPAINKGSNGENTAKIDILGHSKEILSVVKMATKIAAEDFPVLISGESGTGKKILAKKIHQESKRNNGEVITVHCSAIEESALEMELFGSKDRPGVLERANGGTIVLDNVDQLPLGVQAKLLRGIISGEIYNVDSNIPRAINVRVISTTNIDIEQAVEQGSFREDLLYRLNIVSLKVPKLSQRDGDIQILSEYFLNLGKDKENYKVLTSKAIAKLSSYAWPGNIQELRNIMERTYILSEDKYIDDSHLPEFTQQVEVVEEVVVEDFSEMTLHELEKRHICKTLDHLSGNKTRAAKALGITVKTLYNKLHSYGLVNTKSE